MTPEKRIVIIDEPLLRRIDQLRGEMGRPVSILLEAIGVRLP